MERVLGRSVRATYERGEADKVDSRDCPSRLVRHKRLLSELVFARAAHGERAVAAVGQAIPSQKFDLCGALSALGTFLPMFAPP